MKGRGAAIAYANIALVKYWGKRDEGRNLPARGSLSISVSALATETTVTLDERASQDSVVVEGVELPPAGRARAVRILEALRKRAGVGVHASVDSRNSFPTASGLASSASGMAALAVAGSAAYGIDADARELSMLARLGSGSAARSIHGGFVEWLAGVSPDGADSYAVPLDSDWKNELRVVLALVTRGPKAVSSSTGMQRTRDTSPFHEAWLSAVDADLAEMRRAIAERDLRRLGEVSERSCLRMHADMMAADPGLLYWKGATIDLVHRVRELRTRDGIDAFFTIDAGPHVKVVTSAKDALLVHDALAAVPGVEQCLVSEVGGPARALGPAEGR